MRFTPPRRRRSAAWGLNLATMLDATFLLLAYFLVTAAVEPPESRLESGLLLRGEGETADLEVALLEIAADRGEAVFRLGQGTLRDGEALRAALRELDPASLVRIRVLPGPRVDAVAAALQAVADAGLREVAYDASP